MLLKTIGVSKRENKTNFLTKPKLRHFSIGCEEKKANQKIKKNLFFSF